MNGMGDVAMQREALVLASRVRQACPTFPRGRSARPHDFISPMAQSRGARGVGRPGEPRAIDIGQPAHDVHDLGVVHLLGLDPLDRGDVDLFLRGCGARSRG